DAIPEAKDDEAFRARRKSEAVGAIFGDKDACDQEVEPGKLLREDGQVGQSVDVEGGIEQTKTDHRRLSSQTESGGKLSCARRRDVDRVGRQHPIKELRQQSSMPLDKLGVDA